MAKILAAFDLATKSGICFGAIGGRPKLATIDMQAVGTINRPRRFAWLFAALTDFFETNHIDIVRYEEPLPAAVAHKVGVTDETLTLLRGAVAILELCATHARVDDVGAFSVRAARKHLLGTAPPKGEGKTEVMRVAKMLGVDCANDNEGDAFAGWSYCCGLANPRLAHLVTPLFGGAE